MLEQRALKMLALLLGTVDDASRAATGSWKRLEQILPESPEETSPTP